MLSIPGPGVGVEGPAPSARPCWHRTDPAIATVPGDRRDDRRRADAVPDGLPVRQRWSSGCSSCSTCSTVRWPRRRGGGRFGAVLDATRATACRRRDLRRTWRGGAWCTTAPVAVRGRLICLVTSQVISRTRARAGLPGPVRHDGGLIRAARPTHHRARRFRFHQSWDLVGHSRRHVVARSRPAARHHTVIQRMHSDPHRRPVRGS